MNKLIINNCEHEIELSTIGYDVIIFLADVERKADPRVHKITEHQTTRLNCKDIITLYPDSPAVFTVEER